MKKILGATIGVCGVLAAVAVTFLFMATTATTDNDESNAQMTAVTTATATMQQATANPMKADDEAMAFFMGDQAVSTEAATTAIFMGDDEANGAFNGVAFFMTDESSGEVTEVGNPARGNMVGFIHTPTATSVAFIHNAQLICEI